MSRRRHIPEQVVRKLREADRLLGEGHGLPGVIKQLWVSEQAKVMIEDFRQDYNRSRPHRAHGMMTPVAFAEGWRTTHEAAPADAELRRRYASAPFNVSGNTTLKKPTTHQLSQQVDP